LSAYEEERENGGKRHRDQRIEGPAGALAILRTAVRKRRHRCPEHRDREEAPHPKHGGRTIAATIGNRIARLNRAAQPMEMTATTRRARSSDALRLRHEIDPETAQAISPSEVTASNGQGAMVEHLSNVPSEPDGCTVATA